MGFPFEMRIQYHNASLLTRVHSLIRAADADTDAAADGGDGGLCGKRLLLVRRMHSGAVLL